MAEFESKFGVDYIQNPIDEYRKTDKTRGISYFDIPAELTLYQGRKHKQSINEIPPLGYDFLWFGFNPDELTKYGIVHKYKTTHGFKLIALDKADTLHWIYESTNDVKVHRFLRLNFGYKSATEIGKRQSDPEPDKFIVRHLQNKLLKGTEYVGYGISDMEGEQTHFHPEICVFLPQNHIEHVGVLPHQYFEKAAPSGPERKKRPKDDSPEMSGPRPSKPALLLREPRTPGGPGLRLGFGDDSPSSPPQIGQLNFGDSPGRRRSRSRSSSRERSRSSSSPNTPTKRKRQSASRLLFPKGGKRRYTKRKN